MTKDLYSIPQTFAETIDRLKALTLQEFDREIVEKQLCYHTREHIVGVQHRAREIFQVIRPYLEPSDDDSHMELLLDLCAVAHDLIQIFTPQTEPHTTRCRAAGLSEAATIERIFEFIHILNQKYSIDLAQFTEGDLRIIRDAITATVCDYDPTEQAIYQPALYSRESAISPVARVLALADIGTLGMEGIEAYNLEGSLLFLEENLDVRSLIEHRKLGSLVSDYPELYENIRQRLLKRARFQVNFAKSRMKRFPQELAGFPPEVFPVLTQQVFQHLTPETIEAIENTTPIAEDTPFEVLLNFFRLESACHRHFVTEVTL